tara:strand:+ start:327 stop:728 length:402 start_codon:yes stop_codon:yes gene_type:complete
MKRLLFPLLAALEFPTAVNAEVDQKDHKMCLAATDYIGCVKAHVGNASTPTRIITQQGGSIIEGNARPIGYAYAGGGYCKNLIQVRALTQLRVLKRYGWECAKFAGMCIHGHPDWGNMTERAFVDPNGPLVET